MNNTYPMSAEVEIFLNTTIDEIFNTLTEGYLTPLCEQSRFSEIFMGLYDSFWCTELPKYINMSNLLEVYGQAYEASTFAFNENGPYIIRVNELNKTVIKKVYACLQAREMAHMMYTLLSNKERLQQIPLMVKHFGKQYVLDFNSYLIISCAYGDIELFPSIADLLYGKKAPDTRWRNRKQGMEILLSSGFTQVELDHVRKTGKLPQESIE
jgi:hypothetical protein